jgi:hypothetical protein
MEKLSLDDGRTVWTSDPLFEAHGEALSTALVGDNLIVMTDSDVVFLDAVGGRVAREGRMLADVHFVRHFVSESSVVSIDGPVRGRGGSYAVYRFALPGSGRAEDVAMSPLGTFDDVRGFMLYDGAVIADRSRMFLGWSVAGADAP